MSLSATSTASAFVQLERAISVAEACIYMRPTLSVLSGRSAWKGPYFVQFPNLRDALQNNVPIKTQARSCTILPNFVGIRFLVHNGKNFVPVMVSQDMVGHKLGEFAHTKKRFTYKMTKNK